MPRALYTFSGDLTGVLIADVVLQILADVAQTEREFIHQRQAEGIAAAKAKGTRFGRIPKQMPDGFDNACKMIATGEMSIREAAESLGISLSTFYRHYRKVKSNTRKYET